jgi:methylaspartate mutase epsilon subunit
MKREGRLVVQPRMGFAGTAAMRSGLLAVKSLGIPAVGTITVDSYTRLNQFALAAQAIRRGENLNGFPLVSHGARRVREVVAGALSPDFPVQVRHGSAEPYAIIEMMLRSGLSATEGGPLSYCLPYGRTPFSVACREWRRSCELLAGTRAEHGDGPHLETFGGCLMGQLCPPSLLVAISVLEGLFFMAHGVESISLSYAQQTNFAQDVEAVRALRRLSGEYFPGRDVHTVLYTYMGMYPQSERGAFSVLKESVVLARKTGAERLVVKTAGEAFGIPTVEQNLKALLMAHQLSGEPAECGDREPDSETYVDARLIVEAVRSLAQDVGAALRMGLRVGYLDVPFCLHPDNFGRSRSRLTEDGRIVWADTGRIPIRAARTDSSSVGSRVLLDMLTYKRRHADAEVHHVAGKRARAGDAGRWHADPSGHDR